MTDESSGAQDEPERKVLAFGKRRSDGQRAATESIARPLDAHSVPAPTDGLVLACACGGTLHEMLNGGFIRCGRCQRVGSNLFWGWERKKP